VKNQEKNAETGLLRQKAEEQYKKKTEKRSAKLSETEILKLIHELEVHQIELELQNEELQLAKSAQEDAFEKYVELYDFAPSGYVTISNSGVIEKINLTGSNMLGTDRSLLINKRFDLFISSETKQTFDSFFDKIFKSGLKKTCEVTLSKNDKITLYVELTGNASEDGKNCQVIINDLTVHKRAEEALVKAKELAETSDHLKSAFLTNMSHELRTPLNSIIGFSGILLHGAAGALSLEQRKQISMILNSGRHLLSLISDLLDMSKIESGQMVVNYELFNIQNLIEDIIVTQGPLAMTKEITIKFEKIPGQGEIVSDRQWIYQALMNLLSNAIKFSDKGSIIIDFYQTYQWVKIEIIDSGIGIREEDFAEIFHPFAQVDNSITRPHHGTGLGLSITKRLIELLDGTIAVKSELGHGSTFIITLPVNESKKGKYVIETTNR